MALTYQSVLRIRRKYYDKTCRVFFLEKSIIRKFVDMAKHLTRGTLNKDNGSIIDENF